MNWKKYLIWIFFGVVGFSTHNIFAQSMSFSAQTSAEKVGASDVFQLSFILKNAPSNTQYKPPSFSDFIVRQGPSQSQSSEINFTNGVREQSSTVQVSYILQPRKVGKFKIDPLEIIIGDKHYFTNAVNIEVVKGSVAQNQRRQPNGMDPFGNQSNDPFSQRANQMMQQMQQQMQQMQQSLMGGVKPGSMSDPRMQQDRSDFDQKNIQKNIFIKVEVDKTKPYVGEQITAKYKLYTRLNMNMQLTQLPSLNGFWSEDFKLANPPKPSIETVNGREFNVFVLKKSALFPQQSGKLVLDPAKAEGMVQILEGYTPTDLKTSVESTPINIQVQPLPTKNQPKNFTGAVGNFTISSSVDSNIVSTDNGTTLHFVIKGSGNLKLIGTPNIHFPNELGISDPQIIDTILRRTPDIAGEKEFNYFVSPQHAGNFTIPAIEFSYFNPATKQYVTLKTNPIKIKVNQGKNSQSVVNESTQDIHNIITAPLTIYKSNFDLVSKTWYRGLYFLALIIFVLLMLLNAKKRKEQSNIAGFKLKKANKIAWKRLATARKLLNTKEPVLFYDEVSKAIWLYLSDKLGLPISILSKENIVEKLAQRNINPAKVEKVNSLLSECEMALYSPIGGLLQKQHTLNNATELIGILESDLKKK